MQMTGGTVPRLILRVYIHLVPLVAVLILKRMLAQVVIITLPVSNVAKPFQVPMSQFILLLNITDHARL